MQVNANATVHKCARCYVLCSAVAAMSFKIIFTARHNILKSERHVKICIASFTWIVYLHDAANVVLYWRVKWNKRLIQFQCLNISL